MALEQFASERTRIQENLKRGLGPEYVSSRPVGGGGNAPYLEGSKAFNLANEIFGFDGWSSTVKQFEVDFCDVDSRKRVDLGVYVIVQVVLKDGTWREDVGYGHAENARNKAAAFEKARKEAVTDGIKRALRQFGNALGNCLYDNKFTRQLSKVKFQEQPLCEEELYRSSKVVGARPSAQGGIPPQHHENSTNTNHIINTAKGASIPVTVKGEATAAAAVAQRPYTRDPSTAFSSAVPSNGLTKAAEFDVTESMLMSSPRQDAASDFSDIDEGDIEICLQQSGENASSVVPNEPPALNPINEFNKDELLAFVPGSQAEAIKLLKPTMKFDTKVAGSSSVAKSLPDKSCPIKRPANRSSPMVTPTSSRIQDRFPARDATPLAHKAPVTPMDSPRPGFVKPLNPPCTPLVSMKKRPLVEKNESLMNTAESQEDESKPEKIPTPEMKKTKVDNAS
ncbi:DNA repair and recombination protein Rad52p [Trichomonascus vanleenenianus]|uniref:DNA repair and recombination protein Rad52p n=1 Tax=Trichomonascus vanleenenianus TaxID=2268995 RepID=UPI003ECA67A6